MSDPEEGCLGEAPSEPKLAHFGLSCIETEARFDVMHWERSVLLSVFLVVLIAAVVLTAVVA